MKHSELNTAEQLHYSKARTFTGSPAVITPDFIDQILVASDTQASYIATGIAQGQLTALKAPSNGEGETTFNTEAFVNKILIADGEILTTEDTIIYQD